MTRKAVPSGRSGIEERPPIVYGVFRVENFSLTQDRVIRTLRLLHLSFREVAQREIGLRSQTLDGCLDTGQAESWSFNQVGALEAVRGRREGPDWVGEVEAREQCARLLRGPLCPVRVEICLLYTSPSPRDRTRSRMPSSA